MRRSRRKRITVEQLEVRCLLTAFDPTQVTTLSPELSPEQEGSDFGMATAIEGNVAVVGAMYAVSGTDTDVRGGAAFVYVRDDAGTVDPQDDEWLYAATLSASNPDSISFFGSEVAISGDTIVVGASQHLKWEDQTGTIFVFDKPDGGWSGDIHENAVLKCSIEDTRFLGTSLAISGSTVVSTVEVWEQAADGLQTIESVGVIFEKPPNGWKGQIYETAVLRQDPTEEVLNWTSVDIEGDTVIIGGFDIQQSPQPYGVNVFRKPESGWGGTVSPSALLTSTIANPATPFRSDGWQKNLVAIDGSTIVLGLPGYSGSHQNEGAALVFVRSGDQWQSTNTHDSLLLSSVPQQDSFLAGDVQIDGNIILLTSTNWWKRPIVDQVRTSVFKMPASGWVGELTESTTLAPPMASASGVWHVAVSIDSGTILAGTAGTDVSVTESGSASIYRLDDVTQPSAIPWTQVLTPPSNGRMIEDVRLWFGQSIAIEGDIAVAGTGNWASGRFKKEGVVWVYQKIENVWTRVAELRSSHPLPFGRFGQTVAISGSTIVVGEPADERPGAVYVFERPATGWSGTIAPTARLSAEGPAISRAGMNVAVDGNTVVVAGFPAGDSTPPVLVFERPSTGWLSTTAPSAVLMRSGTRSHSGFGHSIAIEGNTIAILNTRDSWGYNVQEPYDSVFVYVRPNNGWTGTILESARLDPPENLRETLRTGYDGWSTSRVQISGSQIVLGVPASPIRTGTQTSDYVAGLLFERPASGWPGSGVPARMLLATRPSGTGIAGPVVAMNDDKVFITSFDDHTVSFFQTSLVSADGEIHEAEQLATPFETSAWNLDTDGNSLLISYPAESGKASLTGIAQITGLVRQMDFGDAPDSYRTRSAANGARHTATGPLLGRLRDGEPDAAEVLDGSSDDSVSLSSSAIDDEDGVNIRYVHRGQRMAVPYTTSGQAGRLYAWIDFNQDGDFDDEGEQIAFGDSLIEPGEHALFIDVPEDVVTGPGFARFRISTDAGLGVDGAANDGEVEDYPITIVDGVPVVLEPGSNQSDNRPLMRWTQPNGLTHYELWMTKLSTNTPVFQNLFVEGTSFQPATPLAVGRYALWVRSVSSEGNRSPWSEPKVFRIDTAPIVKVPGPVVGLRPQIQWQPLSGAVTYEIWIDNLTMGRRQLYATSVSGSAISFIPDAPLPAGTYRYWVRAIDAGNQATQWSAPQQFTIRVPFYAPQIDTLADRPEITWVDTAADEYEVYFQEQGQPFQIYRVQSHRWVPGHDLAPGRHFIWVRPVDALARRSFAWSQPLIVSTNGRPRLKSPAGITGSSTPQFSWYPVEGAVRYSIQIRNARTDTPVWTADDVTQTNHSPPMIFEDGDYQFWVQAIAADGRRGWWSPTGNFSVTAASVELPVNNIRVSLQQSGQPLLTWTKAPNMLLFDVFLTDGFRVMTRNSLPSSSFAPDETLDTGTWTFWVRAMSTDGRRGAWSQPFRFTADDYTVLEQTNTVGSVPQLSWLPIINAVRYEVFIQHMETLTVTKMSVYTSTTSVPSVLGSGRYRVWVRSISLSGDYGLWSQPVTVDVI